MKVTLIGMKDAEAQMQRIARGVISMRNTRVEVGTRMPYGYGIEYGHHRVSGKLARRRGGLQYLHQAQINIEGQSDQDISQGLKKVTAPGAWIPKRLGRWVRRVARSLVTKRSGRLRRGIGMYVNGRKR